MQEQTFMISGEERINPRQLLGCLEDTLGYEKEISVREITQFYDMIIRDLEALRKEYAYEDNENVSFDAGLAEGKVMGLTIAIKKLKSWY